MRDELIVESLAALGVPRRILEQVPVLSSDVLGLLVYGSRARGDAIFDSDLDLLALSKKSSPSAYSGLVNVSFYTADQLESGVGTLFGAHLNRDARVVWDPTGQLEALVEGMGNVNTVRLLNRVRDMSRVFGSLQSDLPKYLPGLLREARYLLRSSLYAQAIAEGNPCFSVRELASRHADPSLVSLLASRQVNPPAEQDLQDCLIRLERIIGNLPLNPHQSLEALIVNEWENKGDFLSIGFMALGVIGVESDYAEMEKILL